MRCQVWSPYFTLSGQDKGHVSILLLLLLGSEVLEPLYPIHLQHALNLLPLVVLHVTHSQVICVGEQSIGWKLVERGTALVNLAALQVSPVFD